MKKKLDNELQKNKPNHVSKQRVRDSKLEKMREQFSINLAKVNEEVKPPPNLREGSQRPLGGQPNKMMNMNINTYQEKKKAAEAKKAEQKKKTMEVVDEDRELT